MQQFLSSIFEGASVSASIIELTVSEKILLAAADLDKQGRTPFTAEDLIIAAWQQYPRTFGLKGYTEQYPDSNKVLSSIMGERGLARKGWLIKMGQKLYALTREGRREAARLRQEEEEPEPIQHVRLTREQEKFLMTLLNSTAVRKFEDNQKNDLAFADACRFWDISQNLKGEAVDERLNGIEQTLNTLEQELSQADAELGNGKLVTAGEIRVLRNIHRYMADRFDRVLSLLRSRAPKR